MEYKDIYSNHLTDIISLIDDGKITGENEALEKFDIYIDTIQEIGSFDLNVWKEVWRKKIWKFGEKFKNINPNQFISKIEKKIIDEKVLNKEVLEFIKSEIIVNFFPENDCKKYLISLIEKYPLNPEFRNTLGHYYSREKEFLLAIEQYTLALKIDPKNKSFVNSRFAQDQDYLTELLTNNDYQKGKDYIDSILDERDYINVNPHIRNAFIDFDSRFNDHLYFQNKLKSLEKDFKERMSDALESERKRIIEVLGFFSAIVAFILSTVSIGKNFSFLEATYFIITLGAILILFAVSMSILFSTSKTVIWKDKKFWILIFALFVIVFIILSTYSISKIYSRFL